MFKRVLLAAIFLVGLNTASFAQADVTVNYRSTTSSINQVSPNNPLPIGGGFIQTARIADISVTNTTQNEALGVAANTARVCNSGTTNTAYVALGGSTITVTASNGFPISAGTCANLSAVGFTYIAAITASSTTTLQISLGSGLASLGGGGSGGSATVPGGSTTQLQYNAAGSFGGISGWTTDGANQLTGGASSTLVIGGGSAITSSGAGGALGTNAFTSTAYAPLASPTFSGTVTMPDASTHASTGLAGLVSLGFSSSSISAAAWTTNGVGFAQPARSYTDSSSSGTVPAAYTNLFGASTILASSATTYTNYYTVFIKAPVASTNVTMTNKAALGVDSLSIGGCAQSSFALCVTGSVNTSSTINAAANISTAANLWMNTNTGILFWGSGNDVSMSRLGAASLRIGGTSADASGSLTLTNLTATGTAIILSGLSTDAAATDTTLCSRSSDGTVLKGSGTLGICLGTSGRQFKIIDGPMSAGLNDLVKIKLYDYHYRKNYGDGGTRLQYGPMAQDVEAVLPILASHDARGDTINYDSGALLFVGLRAIQELKADNDNLRHEINKLKQIVR